MDKSLALHLRWEIGCVQCGKRFLRSASAQTICSDECRRQRYNKNPARMLWMSEYQRERRERRDRKAQAFSVLVQLLEQSDADPKTKKAIERLREFVEVERPA